MANYKGGSWQLKMGDGPSYYISYIVPNPNFDYDELVHFVVHHFNSGKYNSIGYVMEIGIRDVTPEVLRELVNKLRDCKKQYSIPDKSLNEYTDFIEKYLILPMEKYLSGDYNANDVAKLYSVAYLPSFGLRNVFVSSKAIKKITTNHQRDLDLVSKDYLIAFLNQGTFNFVTSDGELLIKLANNNYTSKELKEYERLHGNLIPAWAAKVSSNKIDYNTKDCALRYASKELLSDINFLIKYISNTSVNPLVMEYISAQIKSDRRFINACQKAGYKEKDYQVAKSEVSENKEPEITIVDKLNVVKRGASVPTFKPIKRDWNRQHEVSIENGLRAEEIILNYERKKLIASGKEELAKDVVWSSKESGDGLGYDIQSFDEVTGQPIFIEVKSRIGNNFDSFKMSSNELQFAVFQGKNYRLYWLVGGKDDNPQLYIVNGEDLLHQFTAVPTEYTLYYSGTREETTNMGR